MRILIYRLGSLGDTIVALPCFHFLAKKFPKAKRYVLTQYPAGKVTPTERILSGTGYVHGFFYYPLFTRDVNILMQLRSQIVAWKPDILIYLTSPRGKLKLIRDYIFFKLCGIPKIIGVPFKKDFFYHKVDPITGSYEHECSRLARTLSELGNIDLEDRIYWDLKFSTKEISRIDISLTNWAGKNAFLTCCAGTKMSAKDWGEERWKALLLQLSQKYEKLGIAFLGSSDEKERCQSLKMSWNGPVINLCGQLTPRESALLIKQSIMFLGHDSGPMHLASSVDTPCVAIFSSRNKPAVWFPFGYQKRHRVIYHNVDCSGCDLEDCKVYRKKCIMSITVDEVLDSIERLRRELQLF